MILEPRVVQLMILHRKGKKSGRQSGAACINSYEKAMILAKEALLEPIDIQDLQARGASNRAEELRLELYDKVNRLCSEVADNAY